MKATNINKQRYNHNGANSVSIFLAVLSAGFILYNVCQVIILSSY